MRSASEVSRPSWPLMAVMVKSVGQRGRRLTDCSLTLKFWGLSDTAAL